MRAHTHGPVVGSGRNYRLLLVSRFRNLLNHYFRLSFYVNLSSEKYTFDHIQEMVEETSDFIVFSRFKCRLYFDMRLKSAGLVSFIDPKLI